jgi:hypothetical protein
MTNKYLLSLSTGASYELDGEPRAKFMTRGQTMEE